MLPVAFGHRSVFEHRAHGGRIGSAEERMGKDDRSDEDSVHGRAPWAAPRLELLALTDTAKTANPTEQTIVTSVSTIFLGPGS